MRLLVLSLSLASALPAAACHGGGGMTPDASEALACVNSGRGDTYAVGLEHMGMNDAFDFKLMSAMPAPPMLNLNTWVIQINWGATGAAVTGASLIVTPFMPDHQYGADAYTPQIQELSTPGQYQISDINTWMPGYWEITIGATITLDPMTGEMVEDSAVYKFCIQA
jgi:hypothetical protein